MGMRCPRACGARASARSWSPLQQELKVSMHDRRDFDIVVVGELNADLILRGDVTPVFGQVEKLIDEAMLTLGSSSAIFACGAARLGLRVAFIGKVGDDEFGRFVLRELVGRGVDANGVVIDPN